MLKTKSDISRNGKNFNMTSILTKNVDSSLTKTSAKICKYFLSGDQTLRLSLHEIGPSLINFEPLLFQLSPAGKELSDFLEQG